MPQNFLACDRDQELLMPPSLREWLPADHFAWFVLAAVDEMDLAAFYASYRADGHGRAAHDPQMMVALLLYAYARGERSSRQIERALHEDVAYRVIAVNQAPDHATIARFRQRHEAAIAELFGEVLALCAEAGLAKPTVLAVDSTKLHANASRDATRTYEQLAKEILEEAGQVDAAEDAEFGDARGDELPPELATGEGRRAWLREAKRRLDDERAQQAKPIAKARPERVREAKRRLEEEHAVEQRANENYEAYRARGVMKTAAASAAHPSPTRRRKSRPARSTSQTRTPVSSRRAPGSSRATRRRRSSTKVRSCSRPSSRAPATTSVSSRQSSLPPKPNSPGQVSPTHPRLS
jgi:transposase